MAQWEELLRLNLLQGQLSNLYETKFPRHIRHCLCFFIEGQDWDSIAVDENKARACFNNLLMHLEHRSVQESNILQGPDFPGMSDYLVKHFQDKPLHLAMILSECLQEERKVLALASQKQDCGISAVEEKWKELDNRVHDLQRQTLEMKKETKSLEVLYENYDYIEKSWQSKEQCVGLAHATVRERCLQQASFIKQTKQMVLVDVSKILQQADQIVAALTDVEVPEWKRRQQMACIGGPVDTSLDHLQKWFSAVAEVLIQVRQLLQKLEDQNKKYNSPDASSLPADTETFALSLLKKLLENALVVEKQPVMSSTPQRPLILKTGVRFTATVRFLANLPEFKCLLKVKPVFDKGVGEIMITNCLRQFDFNRDNSKVMDVDSPNEGLVVEFAHMSLKEKKARTRGSSESHLGVTEELHVIKFLTGFRYAGVNCDIEACSLPVVVISSTAQIPAAWASVMWYNLLSTSEPRNLLLFVDPPPLTWQQLSQVLSWQFLSVGQRELDENQLLMLREKIVDNPDGLVHWSKFKNDTTWIWIDGILDLIKRHLTDLWRDGYIMGFVSRKTTQILLQQKPTGTFLLRFSESIKDGAITFSWVEHTNGESRVHAVEPYTKKDLLALSLPDIIYLYSMREEGNRTRNPLCYLYPNIPRDAAFGHYYSAEKLAPKKDVTGYIDRKLVPFSVYPTPPSSPPPNMEVDWDNCAENDQLFHDLFSDLLDLPGSPLISMSPPPATSHSSPFWGSASTADEGHMMLTSEHGTEAVSSV
ncbi:signal transducer and activator of transcription 1-alpha/beta-like isoform X2 [Solea solea]|uniref:signal transducer and activator of transcription 1-alpha/beta-like isoform X2 n=1 Tax=Solea solea TaxID=90069 RepID=UPI00272D7CC9|nr:signal transducer and activator of transcription 1-alpha/beta-like isoform X2 [Solea solea]